MHSAVKLELDDFGADDGQKDVSVDQSCTVGSEVVYRPALGQQAHDFLMSFPFGSNEELPFHEHFLAYRLESPEIVLDPMFPGQEEVFDGAVRLIAVRDEGGDVPRFAISCSESLQDFSDGFGSCLWAGGCGEISVIFEGKTLFDGADLGVSTICHGSNLEEIHLCKRHVQMNLLCEHDRSHF